LIDSWFASKENFQYKSIKSILYRQ